MLVLNVFLAFWNHGVVSLEKKKLWRWAGFGMWDFVLFSCYDKIPPFFFLECYFIALFLPLALTCLRIRLGSLNC